MCMYRAYNITYPYEDTVVYLFLLYVFVHNDVQLRCLECNKEFRVQFRVQITRADLCCIISDSLLLIEGRLNTSIKGNEHEILQINLIILSVLVKSSRR